MVLAGVGGVDDADGGVFELGGQLRVKQVEEKSAALERELEGFFGGQVRVILRRGSVRARSAKGWAQGFRAAGFDGGECAEAREAVAGSKAEICEGAFESAGEHAAGVRFHDGGSACVRDGEAWKKASAVAGDEGCGADAAGGRIGLAQLSDACEDEAVGAGLFKRVEGDAQFEAGMAGDHGKGGCGFCGSEFVFDASRCWVCFVARLGFWGRARPRSNDFTF